MCHVSLVYCGLSLHLCNSVDRALTCCESCHGLKIFFLSHIYDMLSYTNLIVHHLSLFQNVFSKMLAHNQQRIVHLIMQAIQKKILYYVVFIRTKATVCYLGECLL